MARKFPPAAKQAATVAWSTRIRDALRADLAHSRVDDRRRRARRRSEKLDLMELRVGYPDRWRDYSALEIDRGPYVLNVLRANANSNSGASSPRSASPSIAASGT